MREIDTLKEANAQLTKKLQEQQGQIDELTKRTKTQEEHVEEMRVTPPSGAQVLSKERKQSMIETNNHYTSPEKEEVICLEGTGEQIDAEEKAD